MAEHTCGQEAEAIRRLCRAVTEDLPLLVPGIVSQIRKEIPSYTMVPRATHEQGVTLQCEVLLTGLISRRPPTQEDSERARALGRLRAGQGLALESVVSAYHVGCREMWNILLQRIGPADHALRSELAGLVGTVWLWIERASSAAADAYGEAVRAEDAARMTLMHRFLGTLTAGGTPTAEHAHLAQALGFDPLGDFQAVCSPVEAWPDTKTLALRGRLHHHLRSILWSNRDNVLIALIQRLPVDTLLDALHAVSPEAPVGVGLVREGLTGAGASIIDALDVLPTGRTGRVAAFADEWLTATVRPQADRLAALLGRCQEAAAEHPDLAETIDAFARHGFSLTDTGRVLHIHPNTVRYRMARWQELTGWDLRTWEGLSASMVAIDLSRRPGP